MKGAEHYREAERLAAQVVPGMRADEVIAFAVTAQVHATLALAAATYDYDWNHADQAPR